MPDGLTIGIDEGWRMFRRFAAQCGIHEGDEAYEAALRGVFLNGCGHVLNLIAEQVNDDGSNIDEVHARLLGELRSLTRHYKQVQRSWPG
jgi:hypothetical protein